jgi:glutamine synthetase type III
MAAQLPDRVATALRDVLKRLATGAVDVELHELDGLESAPRAHDELAAGRGSGKRVVRVAGAACSPDRSSSRARGHRATRRSRRWRGWCRSSC